MRGAIVAVLKYEGLAEMMKKPLRWQAAVR